MLKKNYEFYSFNFLSIDISCLQNNTVNMISIIIEYPPKKLYILHKIVDGKEKKLSTFFNRGEMLCISTLDIEIEI